MGRTHFSRAELSAIKALLQEIRRADRSRQKVLRARLRRQFDFYISDFAKDQQGFVASEVDALVRSGVITLFDGPPTPSRIQRPAVSPRSRIPPVGGLTARGRGDAPDPPRAFTRAALEAAGFIGWRSWAELRASDLAEVPPGPGAYVVYRLALGDPSFLETSPAGRFKGRDPTVPTETLADNWVAGAHVVYIGKADALRRRLRQYGRFGAGRPVGHWGGRYIWQLADSDELLIAWRAISWNEVARDYEQRLLRRFAEVHDGRRPFANLTG